MADGTFTTAQDLADLGLVISASDLLTDWVQAMQAAFPGWAPAAGNLEYVDATVITSLIANLNLVASQTSQAIFRNFGQKLAGIPPLSAAVAAASISVTAANTAGYTLPAGTQVTLSSLAFYLPADLSIPAGSSSASATVLATQAGADFNGAGLPVSLVSQIDWVSSVSLVASATGGADQEDDSAYLNRLVQQLQLQAPRPITASNFGTMALSFTPAAGTDQEDVGRATAIDGYDPAASITKMAYGTGSRGSNTTGNEREVTVYCTDSSGNALNADTYTAVQAWLDSLREANFIVNVGPPTYITVYVSAQVKVATGFDTTATNANVVSAVQSFLSPASWGLPIGLDTGDTVGAWQNTVTVYQSQLMKVIQTVPGVDHVVDGTLKFDTVSPPVNTSDLALNGACVLPTAGTVTITN